MTQLDSSVTTDERSERRAPFYVTKEEERRLRREAERLVPSPIVFPPSSFDEYVRQLMVPKSVMDLARKAANIRLSAWEVQAIRTHLEPADSVRPRLLRSILERKAEDDASHPPYIRVACTGVGRFDEWAEDLGYEGEDDYMGDYGSPVVLEIWPAQHYSPIHSHGDTTGIVYCLAGELDVMVYGDDLAWDMPKAGLLTLTPGQCAWLDGETYAVHKVACPTDGNGWTRPGVLNNTGDFAASFHVYLNEDEAGRQWYDNEVQSRDEFKYVHETDHDVRGFTTFSDLSWRALRAVLAKTDLDPVSPL